MTLKSYSGKAVPLLMDNVDTDQLIPAEFLKLLEKKGLGRYLFYRWRYDQKGNENTGFLLNDIKFRDGTVLIGLRNFGIGSSRENAVWALVDYGFRVVLAESFGDIFYENAVKNGLILVRLDINTLREIGEMAKSGSLEVTVDLEKKRVSYGGKSVEFQIDESVRKRLMSGKSEIEVTMDYNAKIAQYESRMPEFLKVKMEREQREIIEG
ncbi:MAG: 3-isopropylmalate dehydratase small subunit [Nitrososphaerota archaeon]|jgi:3-isopropylmalate dehydratase small subunit|nr:3-isopropylmalate dehydratase small subunit [Nitrososphaerota archaeon]MDG6931147.1 3-isopropylmalate dehydratase small subunit [Nitrososphaerota archaeon]MDG6932287.1 3-isopropylmalate dehydratase small subunit [Nitrososphaerota archaeon]